MTKLQLFRDKIMDELILASTPNNEQKDILLVVHNQLPYVKNCIQSIVENTENYNLHVWDNASDDETRRYLKELRDNGVIWDYTRSETNEGFIKPNNFMASQGYTRFLILLNSDCEVRKGWDLAMINYLETNHDVAQVGYCGSKLDHNAHGRDAAFGFGADYICGWCMCYPRDVYNDYGLFDEDNLEFAYAEDSDLSFRLRDAGWKIYSLHNDLVVHHGNKTITDVHQKMPDYLRGTFERNHDYIRTRWSKFLNH